MAQCEFDIDASKMGIALLLFIGVITAVYFYLRHKMSYWKSRGVPCDEPSLLLGNLDGVGGKIHFIDNMRAIYEKFKHEHKFCGFYLLQSARVLVMDLDLVKSILIKDFHYFADRGIYNDAKNDPLSAHLFALEGKTQFPMSQVQQNLITRTNSKAKSGKTSATNCRRRSQAAE
jgi:cytochrome P450 family 6